MDLKNIKNFLILLCTSVFFILNAEDAGEFYKIPDRIGDKTSKGLAEKLADTDAVFRYRPGYGKMGILNDLYLTSYAISHDKSVLALSESQKKDEYSLNRIIFFDFNSFQIINGIEFKSDASIQKIFFFSDNLFCVMKGEKITLKVLSADKKLSFLEKEFTIPTDISDICCSKDFIYIKCSNNTLLQLNGDLQKISELQTRRPAGLLFFISNNQLVNFTADNTETIRCGKSGIFKSTFSDLNNRAVPTDIFPLGDPTKSLLFTTADGELHELINFSYSQKCEVADFQTIFYNTDLNAFYSLAMKKHQIEIITLPDLKVKKRLSHDTMRPKTHRNLKFMIPHPQGIFIITQHGEFIFIKEHKKRFFKEKIR